jgi:hypothetical protein
MDAGPKNGQNQKQKGRKMIESEQAKQERLPKRSLAYSGWTFVALFLAAVGIVFAFAETGTAAVGQATFFDSPPPSPIESPLPIPAPIVESISPGTGVVDRPRQVNIYGANFQQKAVVKIAWESNGRSAGGTKTGNTIELNTTFISSQHLTGKVPANIATGVYGVKVVNPDDQESETLHSAYEAASADPQETDDLNARAENLWATPNTLIAGESASIGLTVFRVGGVGGLAHFAVDFYADEVDAENLIGRGIVTGISPDSSATTSAVTWTPATYGEIRLIAVIDPDGQVDESNEGNNTIRRRVNVHYSQPADTTPPLAQSLSVNGGANQVSEQVVTLSIEAVDPDPNPTGVDKSYYVELHWAGGVGNGGAWIPVKWTDWNSYANQPHDYEMMPNSGLRYLQGWVADAAGNISAKPATQRVNYIPATDTLLEGEIRVYRPATLADQCLRVRVEPASQAMDPDLYVWPPNHTPGGGPAGYSILGAGEVDEVILQPTQAGIYQVEIVGFTDATFTQSIEVLTSCPIERTTLPAAPSAKELRQDPSVPVEDVPVGTEAAPETIKQYLSFISVTLQEVSSAGANISLFLPAISR